MIIIVVVVVVSHGFNLHVTYIGIYNCFWVQESGHFYFLGIEACS